MSVPREYLQPVIDLRAVKAALHAVIDHHEADEIGTIRASIDALEILPVLVDWDSGPLHAALSVRDYDRARKIVGDMPDRFVNPAYVQLGAVLGVWIIALAAAALLCWMTS